MRKGMGNGVGSEQLLAGQESALGKLEETSTAAVASGGRGVLSFLNPPTSEAEAFAAAAITERYRLLGEEADARAARARWKRRRSARMVSARASLNMLYAKERQLWQVMAAEGAASAAKSGGVSGVEAAAFSPTINGVLERKEASSTIVARGESGDGDREETGSASEEAAVEDEVGIGDDGEEGNAEIGSEVEKMSDAIVQPGGAIPDAPNEDDTMQFSSATFSPVTIVDEPGGKSVGVSAALDSLGDEAHEIKFSHVQILQEPGGKSCGVSGALSAEADGLGSKALAAEPLPGRCGARNIVQEPGGNSYAVASILGHGFNGEAAMASRVGGFTPVEESGERGDTMWREFGRRFAPCGRRGGCGGRLDWRRPANLDAAFAASASATGLDSVLLAKMFRYEVDPTCAGVLGGRSTGMSAGGHDRSESGSLCAPSMTTDATHTAAVRLLSSRRSFEEELYSPTALSFVSPVLEVKWPAGVLLQTGVLYTYGAIHRSLFRHQLALHRLRRLRVALRELDACLDASSGGVRSRPRGRMNVLDDDAVSSTRQHTGTGVRWDRGRIHWLHLFRHEMQHLADSLQNYFAEQAEAGWPDLRRSLSAAREGKTGGGLAALVAAHSRYISRIHSFMFLGADRQGAVARARIGDFYGVVCTVSRITDVLLSSKHPVPPSPAPSFSTAVADLRKSNHAKSDRTEEMILPDEAFAQLAAVRERFDSARRGLCEALMEICDAGGGARARPLLAIIGYGGYGGDDL
ncbi:unnamed protein product [Scytosiphon promiscuus]